LWKNKKGGVKRRGRRWSCVTTHRNGGNGLTLGGKNGQRRNAEMWGGQSRKSGNFGDHFLEVVTAKK